MIFELSEEIINNFKSKLLQEEWENLQKGILTSHHKRNKDYNEDKAVRERELNAWRAQNKQVQASLDDNISELRFKFNDLDLESRNAMDKFEYNMKNAPKVRWHRDTLVYPSLGNVQIENWSIR